MNILKQKTLNPMKNYDSPPLAGAVVGIIGGNGAGKSTLFRMIMGEEVPDGGKLELGDTVVPMYVDQGRTSLEGELTVRVKGLARYFQGLGLRV
jgi:ABC-type polysaccharide/polyol phosphate transport system ATPase subunit